MGWFNFLKQQGYFNPENNPDLIPVKDGIQVPYWESLSYLEKLSVEFKKGNQLEFVDEVISVIKNVSEHPKDNYRTWYLFIKILANFPNEKIPKEIFHFIPVWFGGRFDTMLQTSELCENLLPKFLNDEPTEDDIDKAELILHYLFQIKRIEPNEKALLSGEFENYQSRVYLHFLTSSFKNLTPKIAKYCSSNFILDLANNIKKLLLYYPDGLISFIKDGDKEYEINIQIDDENLTVSSRLKNSDETYTVTALLHFEELDENDLRQRLVEILQQQGINYVPENEYSDTFEKLYFSLTNDMTSLFGLNAISKLGDSYHNDEKVSSVFSLIFRDLLDEKAKQNPDETISLLKTFCFDKKYHIPFYKRIALYVISQNWYETKSLFWELVRNNDYLQLFSKYKYQKDLYELLDKNQQCLTETEKIIIQNIIDNGKQTEINTEDKNYLEYWQLGWYSALKNVEPFNEKYVELSHFLNITSEHYKNLGEIKTRSGSISPISKDQLLEKTNQEIVDMLNTFHPKDNWDTPNISGLSEILGNALEDEPQKFSREIDLYFNISYIYFYRLINAFSDAWKKNLQFDWENVLRFCLSYIQNDKFYSNQLIQKNDSWNAKSDWAVGSIASLLTNGMQNDNHAFSLDLLPIAKEILQILVNNLEPVNDFKATNMDYPTYSLNSTAGKTLRALFDYSLFRARNYYKYEDAGKWEPEMKKLFEQTLEKGILDGHILEGMYFEQFYFLDKDWITEQVRLHYNVQEQQWLAFLGGFAFGNPPFNKEIYTLFYPHYLKAIEDDIELKGLNKNGLIRHLVAFYFWGYETLEDKMLIYILLNKGSNTKIEEFVNYVWQQSDYSKELKETERITFEQSILNLWVFLSGKYENSTNDSERKILASLSKFIVFIPELNEAYTQLIIKSSKDIGNNFYTHELLKSLVSLKSKGNPINTAKFIGEIISVLDLGPYIANFDQKLIVDLIQFLFEHNQRRLANDFCNNMAVKQQFFLREIYEINNSQQI